jgi:hypothetical protein
MFGQIWEKKGNEATRQRGNKGRRQRGNKLVRRFTEDLVVDFPGFVVVLFGGFLFSVTHSFGFHFPALVYGGPAPGRTFPDADRLLIYFDENGISMAAWENADCKPAGTVHIVLEVNLLKRSVCAYGNSVDRLAIHN